jgi:hypothetical protein
VRCFKPDPGGNYLMRMAVFALLRLRSAGYGTRSMRAELMDAAVFMRSASQYYLSDADA